MSYLVATRRNCFRRLNIRSMRLQSLLAVCSRKKVGICGWLRWDDGPNSVDQWFLHTSSDIRRRKAHKILPSTIASTCVFPLQVGFTPGNFGKMVANSVFASMVNWFTATLARQSMLPSTGWALLTRRQISLKGILTRANCGRQSKRGARRFRAITCITPTDAITLPHFQHSLMRSGSALEGPSEILN